MKTNPLGIFNFSYDQLSLPETAAKMASEQFKYVQFDPRFPLHRFRDDIYAAPHIKKVRKTFEEHDISIAALAGYTNLTDPNLERREAGIRDLEKMIEACQEYGTKYVATQSGSLNPDNPWGDFSENKTTYAWDQLLFSLERVLNKAKKYGVTILIEGYVNNIVASTEDTKRLIKELGSDELGFILDPFNYFTKNDMTHQREALVRIFEAIAAYSPIAHAKDVIYTEQGIDTPKVGAGACDWKLVAEMFAKYTPESPLILEHLNLSDIKECKQIVKDAYASIPNSVTEELS